MLRLLKTVLNFMEGTDRAIEALVMLWRSGQLPPSHLQPGCHPTIHDSLQGVLKLFMRSLKAAVLVSESEGTRIHQLQCYFNRYAFLSGHEIPILLYILQNILHLLASRAIATGAMALLSAPSACLCAFETRWALDRRRFVLLLRGRQATIAAWAATSFGARSPRIVIVCGAQASISALAGVAICIASGAIRSRSCIARNARHGGLRARGVVRARFGPALHSSYST